MTWTFLNAPDTTSAQGRVDFVRSLIQDTDPDNELLQDEEITAYLTLCGNNVLRAAAMSARVLGGNQSDSITVGDLSLSNLATNYHDLARSLDMQADMGARPYAGGISASDKLTREQDSDRVVPAFSRTTNETPGMTNRPLTST